MDLLKKRQRLIKEIEIPEGIEVKLDGKLITIKGPKGEISKLFDEPLVSVEVKDGMVKLLPNGSNNRQKMYINTYLAHLKNMFKGVQEGFEYKLKICSSHFPMSVSVSGNKVIIKNFLGEKVPREAIILPNVEVKINGDEMIVVGVNKEFVGQTAANIELATKIKNLDRRIFQDGIWITKKADRVI